MLVMEKEGFIRVVDNLRENHGTDVNLISTDRHVQIKKLMKTNEKYKNINHQFDPWHIAKGILKKLTKQSKKKGVIFVIFIVFSLFNFYCILCY